MKKRLAMILAIVLAVMLILPLIISFMEPAGAASTVDELKNKAKSLAEQKKQLSEELKQLEQEKKDVTTKKVTIDKQIEVTEQEIENAEALIEQYGVEIALLEDDLAQAIEREEKEYDLFLKRVRAMEEGGTASYLGILLSSDSFSGLLGRAEIIGDLIEYDKKVMENMRIAREAVFEAKLVVEENKASEEEVRQTLVARREEFEAQHIAAQALIDSLAAEEAEAKKALEKADEAEKELQKQIAEVLAELARKSKKIYVGGEYGWPIPGYYDITSEYGTRWHPILKTYKLHTGVDIGAPMGAKIYAANTGTVVQAGYNAGYGNYVLIDHGGGQATLYAHMSKILVKANTDVIKGDNIGLVGSTGYSTGPHLHFEIIIDGKYKNPMDYFKAS